MTLQITDWAALGGSAAQLLGLGATWLYLRGKLDGHSLSDGARITALDDEIADLRETAAKTATALDYHLSECARQYEAVTEALKTLDRRMDARLERLAERLA
jgi:hypothetical protein